MMIPDATFDTTLVRSQVVYLIDRNERATRSVTNDAEQVVPHVLRYYPGYRLVYRDTMGRWDELVHDGSAFTGFAPWDGATA